MMQDPRVTVVVPTRDRAALLGRTLGTVLGQRDVIVEVVVVDEGSSDSTPRRLLSLGPRITVIRHDNPLGLPAARNAGLRAATSPWVAFCDDDDLWAPDKLACQVAACERSGARWSVGGSVNIDVHDRVTGAQRPVGGDVRRPLSTGNVVPGGGSGVLVSQELIATAGGFDEHLRAAEDFDMWTRLAEHSHLAAVDRPLVAYRVWPGTMSTDVERQRHNHEQVLGRGSQDGAPPEERAAARLRHEQYLARGLVRSRRRGQASRAFVAMALSHRRSRHLAHAGAALASPRMLERHLARRERSRIPSDYLADAQLWLSEVPRSAWDVSCDG